MKITQRFVIKGGFNMLNERLFYDSVSMKNFKIDEFIIKEDIVPYIIEEDFNTIEQYISSESRYSENRDIFYIYKLNNLFKKYKEKLVNILKATNMELWDISDTEEIKDEIILEIKERYININDSKWKTQLNSIFLDIYDKLNYSLANIDELYEDNLLKCEEIYNLMDCMFPQIEEVLKINFQRYLLKSKEKEDDIGSNNEIVDIYEFVAA